VLDALDAMIANFARRHPAGPSDADVADVSDVADGPTEETYTATHESDWTHIDGTLARVVSPTDTSETSETSETSKTSVSGNVGVLPTSALVRECFWHLAHGERIPRHLCAGCRRPILPGETALDLADTNRVHFPHGADGYACLIRYGQRWRRAAREALHML
jgi:hypothetical protein